MWSDGPPEELNRLDSKNWTPTPPELQSDLAARVLSLAEQVDAMILMDQVDLPDSGAACSTVVQAAREAVLKQPKLLVLADSRRGLADFPPLGFKMNATELSKLSGSSADSIDAMKSQATTLAAKNQQPVFVTLAERGIVGALPNQPAAHVTAHPIRGPIDIVGAGDATMANLAAALAGGATLMEAMELAMAAASIVIHQLGTTGTASVSLLQGYLRA
jgi:bifunctional ADP-heptose synthase (sugar kinase/adenylyltransferase)